MNTYKISVNCSKECGKETEFILRETIPGVFTIIPPEKWLFNNGETHILFICEDCAQTLKLKCQCGEIHHVQ
jgi:hypothetical protein